MAKLKFECAYCPTSFDKVTELFDHYENEHKNRDFKRYRIKHIPSGNKGMASATSPEKACKRLCWNIKDCVVREEINERTFGDY